METICMDLCFPRRKPLSGCLSRQLQTIHKECNTPFGPALDHALLQVFVEGNILAVVINEFLITINVRRLRVELVNILSIDLGRIVSSLGIVSNIGI